MNCYDIAVKDDRVSYYTMRKVYSHDLGIEGKHFTAYNMAFGTFGGVRGRDMIIVQSLDGKLQIFEQSAHAFSRQLSDCLIPGPIAYIPKIDAFVTVNYSGQAECYRYQVLASSQSESKTSEGKEALGSFGLKSIRSSVMEWSTNFGESCRQILVGNFISSTGSAGNELLFICDKSIFLVKAETGGIIQQRRFDRADAACACLIPIGGETFNCLIAGNDKTVQVYSGFHLVWAAKLTCVPVHMQVATFGSQKGLIVAVDDAGFLSINYLGTKPPMQTVLSQARDLDYDKIDEEHRGLLQIIRDSQGETRVENNERLLIKSQISNKFDLEHINSNIELPNTLVPLFPASSALDRGDFTHSLFFYASNYSFVFLSVDFLWF